MTPQSLSIADLKAVEIANEMFKGCKPLDGEPLRILNQTLRKQLSQFPTSLLKPPTEPKTEEK